VRGLLDLLGLDRVVLDRLTVVCAGPVTARAASEAGLSIVAISEEPGPRGIAAAIGAARRERKGRSLVKPHNSAFAVRSAQ
jgi:uroporphyrinogen-III synthase